MSHLPTTGLSLLAQSTLLLCLGLCAAHVLRSRGPTIRAFVLQMTLLGIALGSILSVSLAGHIRPVWQMPVRMVPTLPNNGGAWHAMPLPLAATPIAIPLAVDHSASAFPVPTLLASPDKTKPFTAILPRLIADLWLAGAGLLLLWLAVCQIRLILLRGHAVLLTTGRALDALARLDAGQSRSMPLLLSSPHIRSPFLAGIVRPAIFLPATWDTDYDDATLHVIFAHELAHRQRQDCAWTLLLRLTSTLLWPQPLLWLLGRQLEQATEEACDLMALTPDCPPRRYADCLLALAERSSPHRLERTFGAGVTPIRSALGRRILNVLDRRNLAMSHLSNRLRVCVMLGTAVLTIGSLSLVSASAPVTHASSVPLQQTPETVSASAAFLAGLIQVQGPGIVVILNDSKKTIPAIHGLTPPNLIHDIDIDQVVNELKAAGAEALAVNNQRLVVTSSVTDIHNTVYINGIRLTAPYVIRAIGNSTKLQNALNLRGGEADQLRIFDPTMIRIEREAHLTLPAYQGAVQDKYARPVQTSMRISNNSHRVSHHNFNQKRRENIRFANLVGLQIELESHKQQLMVAGMTIKTYSSLAARSKDKSYTYQKALKDEMNQERAKATVDQAVIASLSAQIHELKMQK
jgi:beta-lactamase regulating signal transducer with metallopeptidase domain